MTAPTLEGSPNRIAVVVHPGRRGRLGGAYEPIQGDGCELETRGDAGDLQRTIRVIEENRPTVVLAAGGDGTVSLVLRALLNVPAAQRPDLAILPLGTANNAARSVGLRSVRTHGASAVRDALEAARSGESLPIDVGRAGDVPFVGSFALGMDGAILARREALRDLLKLRGDLGGYPLYLASCATEAIVHRPVQAEIDFDGERSAEPIFNLLVTSRPLYAGEFRFASSEGIPQGHLSCHVFENRSSYLRSYAAAWRRHVAHTRGKRVAAATGIRPVRRLGISLAKETAAQLDGEQVAPRTRWDVEVIPSAVRLRRPRAPRSRASAN